jgi:hypothetical protein
VLYGFKDIKSAGIYFDEVQRVYNDYLIIEKMIYLSKNNIVKNDGAGLLDILSIASEDTKPNMRLFNSLIKKNRP